MARIPKQARSRAKVERVLDAAQTLLGRAEPITARSLSAEAKVSPGTIYQFFDDMDDVLDAVFERASALVHSALEEHRLEQHATEPSVFFPAIIATIDELQRNHPVMGCVVRPGQQGSLNNELAQRLRTQLVKRTVEMFVAAYPHAPRQRVADVIKLSATALFAVLAQSPAADDPCRGPYLADAASLAAVFVALKLRDATP